MLRATCGVQTLLQRRKDAPHVLVVPKRVEAKSVAELLKMARANPGKMNYASAGIGTTLHFCAEMFKDETGANIVHVPYKGGGPALVDTLSGQVDMSFPTLSAALPHVKAGNLKALAVTSSTRAKLLPDVPTMQEAGVKGFEFTQWLAILAPAGSHRSAAFPDRAHYALIRRPHNEQAPCRSRTFHCQCSKNKADRGVHIHFRSPGSACAHRR